MAVGDANGIISMLEVCDSLAQCQQNEKALVNSIFERETKREKMLEVREREVKRASVLEKERLKTENETPEVGTDSDLSEMLRGLEQDFFQSISANTE